MQKLLCALLASTVSASELLLAQKAQLSKNIIQGAALDIDIDPGSIIPCQYITKSSVFSFQNVMIDGQPNKASAYEQPLKDHYDQI